MNKGMYPTKCGYCGKEMYTFAKNKMGDLPTVFCGKVCQANAKYEKRFK